MVHGSDTSPASHRADEPLARGWHRVIERLRHSMTPSSFELWIVPLTPVAVSDSSLVLAAPSRVSAWVERRYGERILALASEEIAPVSSLTFTRAGEGGPPASPAEPTAALVPDSSHTFERFVIGRQNRLAHGAALAVAELPGDAYNPLFIHGRPGLGKSHLLGAIANYLGRTRPEMDVRLTTAERFTAEFVGALRAEGPEAFKRRYRSLDALLIDDVQFLEGKERTEEEFVHTFNELYTHGAQIVLSSDRPPRALERLAERLRDRFDWGLCVEMEPPDVATRLAVVRRILADSSAPEAPAPVLRDLAATAPANMRRLEGLVTRAVARASLLGEPLSGADRGERASQPPPAEPAGEPSVEAIQEAVCSVTGLTRHELVSKSRTQSASAARQLAIYLARELTSLSLAEISRAFRRDHSTVLHALRRMEGRLEPGSPQAEQMSRARRMLVDDTPAENPLLHGRGRLPPPSSTSPSPAVEPNPPSLHEINDTNNTSRGG